MSKSIQITAGTLKPVRGNTGDSINLLKRTMRISADMTAISAQAVVKSNRPMIRKIVKPISRPMLRFRPKRGTVVSENQVKTFFAGNDRYQVQEPLGKGGMAQVFKAHDRFLNLDVALKFLPKEMLDDNDAIEAFRNEARIVMQLSHKNIVRLHTLDVGAGTIYLVMEYVEGRNFVEIMSQMGRLKIASVVQIARSCAAALDYAHGCSVLHKDLKPANLMLNNEAVLKIVDFGIARHMAEGADTSGNLFLEGTFPYMSPEQLEGKPLDRRTDVYSLAAVLYEFLAGKPILPFDGNPEDMMRVEPEPIDGLTDNQWAVLHKALAKQREGRWSSAGEFHDALAAVTEPIITG